MPNYPSGVRDGALAPIHVMSIYNNYTAFLPARMAWLTPDAAQALSALQAATEQAGGHIFLSDAFRSSKQQACAYYDYLTGHGLLDRRNALVAQYPYLEMYEACNNGRGKQAFSPPPGGSVHEAGRAIDLDLDTNRLGIDQTRFAQIAYSCGWNNIVGGVGGMGNPYRVDVKEEWHWEFRGPFMKTYATIVEQTGEHDRAYKGMVEAMIQAIQ